MRLRISVQRKLKSNTSATSD